MLVTEIRRKKGPASGDKRLGGLPTERHFSPSLRRQMQNLSRGGLVPIPGAICSWLLMLSRPRSNSAMADKGWQRKFEDLIPLPAGRKLVTLRDAADYITRLPKKESALPEWQTAIEVLMLVSRGGPMMMARIGVMRALNRHVERVFNPSRKSHHWGKRKLKREQ
jgi:hypothetical protein